MKKKLQELLALEVTSLQKLSLILILKKLLTLQMNGLLQEQELKKEEL
jgi:hypothetical protein